MDVERLIGASVHSIEGIEIGEIVGIEIYGTKIHLIIDSMFDFEMDGGPDGDGGERIPVQLQKSGESEPKTVEKIENVINFRHVAR